MPRKRASAAKAPAPAVPSGAWLGHWGFHTGTLGAGHEAHGFYEDRKWTVYQGLAHVTAVGCGAWARLGTYLGFPVPSIEWDVSQEAFRRFSVPTRTQLEMWPAASRQ